MRRKILIIVLTGLIFLSAAILGVTTVFRIDTVTLNTSKISAPAEAEAEALRERLMDIYDKNSIFTAKRSEAEAIMSEFPYFRITDFKRSYPNRIVVSLVEDEEVYAVETAASDGNYYILSGSGTILGIRENASNRLDGERNVALQGLTVSGEKGGTLSGDDALLPMLTLCGKISGTLNGIRGNVVTVRVLYRTSTEDGMIFSLTMQEGLKIYVYDVMALTEKKAEALAERYLSLSDAERMSGCLMVYENKVVPNEITVSYLSEDIDGELTA